MNLLEAENINKSFGGKSVLQNVSFRCEKGEILGIFGRNGTGKSSLLKIVFGTLNYDSGSLKLDNEISSQKEIIPGKEISYLPQDTFLPKNMKVRDVIPFFFPRGSDQDRIFYSKGVGNFTERKIKELPMGQLRYLEILLIGNLKHSFMLLDEPFSMIEPIYKDVIKEFLISLKGKKGIILTDHYYEDVLQITDKNFLIRNGELVEIRSKKDLIKNEYLNQD